MSQYGYDEPLFTVGRRKKRWTKCLLLGLGGSASSNAVHTEIPSFTRSPEAEIFFEAEQLVAHGAKELVLTGVNIGSFDSCGKSIVDIVDKVNTIDGLARVRISSIEPTTIPLALFERMADDAHALTPYLHIPVQSGSDRVLARMRRKYTRAEFTAFIEQAAARVPGIGIGTDILVGSPGETDADFEETCALLADGPFAYAHVFKYSERDGTAAQRFEPKVVPQEKNRRSARVRLLSDRKLAGFHAQHTGQPASVLFETAENGVWSGYTGNYIRVAARSNAILANEMCEVILDRTCGDFMVGRLAHEPAEVVA